MGAIVWTGASFIAGGGLGTVWASQNGVDWTAKAGQLDGLPIRTIVRGAGGVLEAAGNGASWRSTDGGASWTYDVARTASNEIAIAECGGVFTEITTADLSTCAGFSRARGAVHAEGVYLRVNGMGIDRSTNGKDWMNVYSGSDWLEDVEVGYVASP
jgi:hypothetical protein